MKKTVSPSFKWIHLTGLLVLAALVLAACQPAAIPVTSATEAPTKAPAPTATTAPAATKAPAVTEPTIKLGQDAKLGQFLVDDKGMTLYIFTKDAADKSNCNAGCLAKWPPLLTAGSPKAGDGVDASMLGSTALADGSKIVTYNHMPLYYWVKDTKAGETTGQNVGTVWFVLSPDGKAVMDTAESGMGYSNDAAAGEPTINVADDAKLGKILVDGKGMTLYLYTQDTPGKSNCSGGCLAAWPPLLTKGKPNLGPGVDAAKVGTAKLADGSLIVTYAGMPLYYYVKDTKAGDTTGQGVGSVWYIVAP